MTGRRAGMKGNGRAAGAAGAIERAAAVLMAGFAALFLAASAMTAARDARDGAVMEKAGVGARSEPGSTSGGSDESGGSEAAPGWLPEELTGLDFGALEEECPGAAAWLLVPGTRMSMPVMTERGREAGWWLSHAPDGAKSARGSAFVEAASSPSFGDPVTPVYAHAMRDGSMFGGLARFGSAGYMEEHPRFYICLPGGEALGYRVFAAGRAGTGGILAEHGGFEEEGSAAGYAREAASSAQAALGDPPGDGARIVTLSTCASGGKERFLVHGALEQASPARRPSYCKKEQAATATDRQVYLMMAAQDGRSRRQAGAAAEAGTAMTMAGAAAPVTISGLIALGYRFDQSGFAHFRERGAAAGGAR